MKIDDRDWNQPGKLHIGLLALLAGCKLLIHVPVSNRYGFFRDELYFLDCARHMDWGYVDHAPLIAVYAKISLLLGGSLPALRILAAVAGTATVVLAGLIAWQLGGRRFAQAIAGLCTIAAPIYLSMQGILTMNAFEPLFWMGCVYLLIRIVRSGDSRLWIWFGLVAGFGIQNKHSTLLFGFALAIALLFTPQRRELLKPWIWLGGLAAFIVFLPNLVWQFQHSFPTLEDLGNVQSMGKNITLNPVEFLAQQVFLLHPMLLPFWVAGLGTFLAGNLRRMRVLGCTYLILLLTMMILKAKNYYLAPVYPMLFAAGAVAIEDWLTRLKFCRDRIWPKAAIVSYVGIMAAAAIPAAVPVLSPENLLAYQGFLGISPPRTEVRHEGPLPQNFGDQFGWEELVKKVADVYGSLSPGERENTAIFAGNYGEAGAINHLGPAYGLPNAICAHQTYYFWGPPPFDGNAFIWLQWEREWLEPLFESVEEVGTHFHPWGMAEENGPIFLCRGLRQPLSEIWPRLKVWN